MDQTAVAEWVVAQVTVRVCPVVSRCRRELGCGIASTAGIIGSPRSVCTRTVVYVAAVIGRAYIPAVIGRTSFRTVVGRTVCNPPVVVRAVAVCTDSAFCADIAHVVIIVPAGIYSRRRIAPALGCLTVGGSIPVYRSIAVGRR